MASAQPMTLQQDCGKGAPLPALCERKLRAPRVVGKSWGTPGDASGVLLTPSPCKTRLFSRKHSARTSSRRTRLPIPAILCRLLDSRTRQDSISLTRAITPMRPRQTTSLDGLSLVDNIDRGTLSTRVWGNKCNLSALHCSI